MTRRALLEAVAAARSLPARGVTAVHPVVWPDDPPGPAAERGRPWVPDHDETA